MRYLAHFTAWISVAALSACAVVPNYQLPANAEVARLNTKSAGNKWICVAGQPQRLVSEPDGYAKLPAGQRITVGSNYANYVYGGVSTSCNPRLSFVPTAGQSYYMDFEIESSRCFIATYTEVTTNRIGLDIDPTMRPPGDCFAR